MYIDLSRIRIIKLLWKVDAFASEEIIIYFSWSRIRLNKYLCKIDAFYLRRKLICNLFRLEFALTNVHIRLMTFISEGKNCLFCSV